jgi:hypothetical protein
MKLCVYCKMDFCDELKASNIDPDKFIALQNEFIVYCRKEQESNGDAISYRDFLERDQLLTMLEKFIIRLERERLQQKIREMSSLSSL